MCACKQLVHFPYIASEIVMTCESCFSFPLYPSGRRKSVAPQELNKSNKRLSHVVKPPEMQTKKGKVSSPLYSENFEQSFSLYNEP